MITDGNDVSALVVAMKGKELMNSYQIKRLFVDWRAMSSDVSEGHEAAQEFLLMHWIINVKLDFRFLILWHLSVTRNNVIEVLCNWFDSGKQSKRFQGLHPITLISPHTKTTDKSTQLNIDYGFVAMW